MAIKIPTIGPEQQIGGSVPLTMQPRDLTYSGLALPKSGVGENLKLLADAGSKFAADLTKVQMQIKKDQDEATLLDLQNTIAQEDLSIFASLIDPDNPDNAIGSNATDAKFNQITQQRKQVTTAAINGEFTGIYADYADRLSGLGRTSKLAFTKHMLANNISFETKLVGHFAAQSKAYKTHTLEVDYALMANKLAGDPASFEANAANLANKAKGNLEFVHGASTPEGVQAAIADDFSTAVRESIKIMIASGSITSADEFYKKYGFNYTVIPADENGEGRVAGMLKPADRSAIEASLSAAFEHESIASVVNYAATTKIKVEKDAYDIDGNKIKKVEELFVGDDVGNLNENLRALLDKEINGRMITQDILDKAETEIMQKFTRTTAANTAEQRALEDDIVLNYINQGREIPESLLIQVTNPRALSFIRGAQEDYAARQLAKHNGKRIFGLADNPEIKDHAHRLLANEREIELMSADKITKYLEQIKPELTENTFRVIEDKLSRIQHGRYETALDSIAEWEASEKERFNTSREKVKGTKDAVFKRATMGLYKDKNTKDQQSKSLARLAFDMEVDELLLSNPEVIPTESQLLELALSVAHVAFDGYAPSMLTTDAIVMTKSGEKAWAGKSWKKIEATRQRILASEGGEKPMSQKDLANYNVFYNTLQDTALGQDKKTYRTESHFLEVYGDLTTIFNEYKNVSNEEPHAEIKGWFKNQDEKDEWAGLTDTQRLARIERFFLDSLAYSPERITPQKGYVSYKTRHPTRNIPEGYEPSISETTRVDRERADVYRKIRKNILDRLLTK